MDQFELKHKANIHASLSWVIKLLSSGLWYY